MIFDHLYLPESHRVLIKKACGDGVDWVGLSPLDKGLSGAAVWLAQWQVTRTRVSKDHVFKIGSAIKLRREYAAIQRVAAAIERGFPQFYLFEEGDEALLRQEFFGDLEGQEQSLRRSVENADTPEEIRQLIRKLYTERLSDWHAAVTPGTDDLDAEESRLADALDWWMTRLDLPRAAAQIGQPELDASLSELFGLDVEQLEAMVRTLSEQTETIARGPVHGDLHAQNILVDSKGNLHLIDYGWTGIKWRAVDFLMLECSLKFAATPPNARIEDLIALEEFLERYLGREDDIDETQFKGHLLGHGLKKVIAGTAMIRHYACTLGAVRDMRQYRRGLIILTACLASIPSLINRVYLMHSIAYHLRQVEHNHEG
jgi:thiamine kinase-like enzyme